MSVILFSSVSGDVNFPGLTPSAAGSGVTPVVAFPMQVDAGAPSARKATASSGAATLNKASGQITSESLSTAAGADYTLTLTNSQVAATDLVMASVQLGSSTTGTPAITSVTPAAGSVVIVVQNIHATAAFNGTVIVSFVDFK